jgi:hypothetical protein
VTEKARVPLYERLPELYRIEDERAIPSGQLRAYLGLVEEVFGELHKNIEALYHDLFIETCDDWVIPFIGDLLGNTHLKGDPQNLRKDVADTIALRRRKGTLSAIELLTRDLTGWGVHATELHHDLAWCQHLNHQRPDAGGVAPYGLPTVDRHTVVRGGTAVLRDPATLALVDSPFDSLAHLPDFKPPVRGAVRLNLANLAVFLWRLTPYRIEFPAPLYRGTGTTGETGNLARRVVRFDLHPVGDAVQLYNQGLSELVDTPSQPIGARLGDSGSADEPVYLSNADVKPGPILRARLNSMRPPLHRGSQEPTDKGIGDLWLDTAANGETETWKQWNGAAWVELQSVVVDELVSGGYGRPEAYTEVVPIAANSAAGGSRLALRFLVPASAFPGSDGSDWTFRGANLIAWEQGLRRPLENQEIAIDPVIGRVAIGVRSTSQVAKLREDLKVTYTYGAVGPVGAHPVDRSAEPPATFHVDGSPGKRLEDALVGVETPGPPVVVEIVDNELHDLSLGAIPSAVTELGGLTLKVARSLTIRAADGKRPVIRLAAPLRFRAVGAQTARQTHVELNGIYLTRSDNWTAGDALIERFDLGRLALHGCTLDPGGTEFCEGAGRQAIHAGVRLRDSHKKIFVGVPRLHIQRSVAGPLLMDSGYHLTLEESIVDGGSGVNEELASAGYAIRGTEAVGRASWGPELTVANGATFFGRVKVERASGEGGIWTQPLEVLNNQTGCIKLSYFTGVGDRLPPNHGCVFGKHRKPAFVRFVSEVFGQPAYGQLSLETDIRVREGGPNDDAMGAFGFLMEAHKWRNIQIRFREFMPVGVRPLLVPMT